MGFISTLISLIFWGWLIKKVFFDQKKLKKELNELKELKEKNTKEINDLKIINKSRLETLNKLKEDNLNLNNSNSNLNNINNELKNELKNINDLNEYKNKLNSDISNLINLTKKIKTEFDFIDSENAAKIVNFYEEKYFSFEDSAECSERLKNLKNNINLSIKNGTAISIKTDSNNLSILQDKFLKDFIKLILRAFNGECAGIFSKIKASSDFSKYVTAIEKSFDTINKLSEIVNVQISLEYFMLKVEEAELIHHYNLKKQEELDEQRLIKEQMREEEKARKEKEKAIKDAELEELRQQKALENARKEYEELLKNHLNSESEKYAEKIALLEKQLEEAHKNKERAISQAQLTKSGHVYIISNIGSFGENVYKIGMTRRLDPLDRVKELGDASVPFPFDVHALIYSNDAPGLENLLHRELNDKRLNMINQKREFFEVSLDEIQEIVLKNYGEFKLTKFAEAEQYRQSLKLKNNKIVPIYKDEVSMIG